MRPDSLGGADRRVAGVDWPVRLLRATMSRSCWSSRGFNFHVLRLGQFNTKSVANPALQDTRHIHDCDCEKETSTMFSGLQNPRNIAAQIMNFGLVLSTAFMVRCDSALPHNYFRRRIVIMRLKNLKLTISCCIDVERSLHRRRLSLSDRRGS